MKAQGVELKVGQQWYRKLKLKNCMIRELRPRAKGTYGPGSDRVVFSDDTWAWCTEMNDKRLWRVPGKTFIPTDDVEIESKEEPRDLFKEYLELDDKITKAKRAIYELELEIASYQRGKANVRAAINRASST